MYYNQSKKLTKEEYKEILASNREVKTKNYTLIFEGYYNGKEVFSKVVR